MSIRVTVHVMNEEPFVADMEALPEPQSAYIHVTNPRTREGKSTSWNTKGATGFLFPWTRITFIEVMVRSEDLGEIEKFYKDETDTW